MTPQTIAYLVNLGAAGAVIASVVLFLKHLEKRDADFRKWGESRDEERKQAAAERARIEAAAATERRELAKAFTDALAKLECGRKRDLEGFTAALQDVSKTQVKLVEHCASINGATT